MKIRDEQINKRFGFFESTLESLKQERINKTYPRYDDSLLVEWNIPANTSESQDGPGNTTISDRMLDLRFPECSNITYPEMLPMTTVVIVFKDESLTTFSTTLWSIYNRSPKPLLKEIIIVDNHSSPNISSSLIWHIHHIPAKIRVFRLPLTTTVAAAKQFGAQFVMTPTITFMDTTCKCMDGWLVPLLTKISENRQIAVTPVIDLLDLYTLSLSNRDGLYGTFDIDLRLQRTPISDRERERLNGDRTAGIKSPLFPGDIFVMDREFFEDIGGFDSQITYHTEEMMEMSLKVWMCGAGIEIVPCARVAHIEAALTRFPFADRVDLSMQKSTTRIVDVWLDEAQKPYYGLHPGEIAQRGNVSEQLEKRHQLQCKSFNWYLENVYPESIYARKYTDIVSIESMEKTNVCLNGDFKKQAKIWKCQPLGRNNWQTFMLTGNGEIISNRNCLTAMGLDKPLNYTLCSHTYTDTNPDQIFIYDLKDKALKHNGASCLTTRDDDTVILKPCNGTLNQKWRLHSFVPPDTLF